MKILRCVVPGMIFSGLLLGIFAVGGWRPAVGALLGGLVVPAWLAIGEFRESRRRLRHRRAIQTQLEWGILNREKARDLMRSR